MSVMTVEMATSLVASKAGLTTLAVDAESPVATANVLGIALAGGAAVSLIELLRSDELVTAVALATVLSTSKEESGFLAVGDTLLIGRGADVGVGNVAESTLAAILEAACKLESTDGASGVVVGARGWHGDIRLSHSHSLPDSMDLGAAAGSRNSSWGGGGRDSWLLGLLRCLGFHRLRDSSRLRGNSSLGGLLSLRGGGVRDRWVLNNVGGRLGFLRQASLGAGARSRRGFTGTGAGKWQVGSREVIETESPATERVAAGKGAQLTGDVLINLGVDGAVYIVEAIEQTLAVVHTGGTSIASVNDVLEKLLVPTSHEIGVRSETSGVTVGENEGLAATAGGPAAIKEGSVPVRFEEQVRDVDPALRAVDLAVASVLGVGHVVLVVGKASLGVVASWEVNVGTQRRGIAVTSHIGETNTLALVDWVTDSGSGTIRVGGPRRGAVVVAVTRASPLDGLDRSLGGVQVGAGRIRGNSGHGITSNDVETSGERLDLIVGSLEAITKQVSTDESLC